MAKGRIAKKGAGGLIESLAKKAERGYLKEITQGKPVKKIPSLKFDRVKGADKGLPDDPNLGEYNRSATGITLGRSEELDDMNALNEMRRKDRRDQTPTSIRGEDSNLNRELKEKGYKGYKKGGHIELGKIGGSKSKRRMDKRAR